ncbi:MAG: alkaline phosphatase family protein [Chitinophagaceae bacterium]|nr:alkaline phosphatase family protein [Chitinophagaceae bacterium]MCW5905492.1 alkaline phosphatase family protein [Chitinophagaceae bacterium]
MKKILLIFLFFTVISSFAQNKKVIEPNSANNTNIARPKLVVGIMIDHMRWDYLYRYQNRYDSNGFNRLLNGGFTCENTLISYTPTATACGHASVYTGTVPAINGIASNNWWDMKEHKYVYCCDDKNVTGIGSNTKKGMMSPRNMVSNTITDELRLATNFKSKVIGVAMKDRGSIFPAGHSANAAYWYDEEKGIFISSSFYMKDLPQWVKDFNAKNWADKYYAEGWQTLYPINTYTMSTKDDNNYEKTKWLDVEKPVFPYNFSKFMGKDYTKFWYMPQAITYTFEMSKAAIAAEHLGKNNVTDFLAISISSTDYMAHTFGPNSIEAEDMYLRLDRDLAAFLEHLDNTIGKGNYLVFLTADHGGPHIPDFLKEHNLPAGSLQLKNAVKEINNTIQEKFGVKNAIAYQTYYNISLNYLNIDSAKADAEKIKEFIIQELENVEGVYRVVDKKKLETSGLQPIIKERLLNGYFPNRSGDIQVIPLPQWMRDTPKGTDHSLWNAYDAHIPLVWYGWGVQQGSTHRETYITDIAATLAALLKIQMPNGCIGHVITEVIK